MTEISLQAGERLRIRTGRRLFLVMRTESSFEVRILRRGMGVRLTVIVRFGRERRSWTPGLRDGERRRVPPAVSKRNKRWDA